MIRHGKFLPTDPDLARQLLAEAGYSEDAGPSIEFMAGKLVGVPELTEIAVPMISWLEEVGFDVDAQIGEFQPIRTRYKAREMNGVLWTHPHGLLACGSQYARLLRQPRLAGAVYMYEDPYTEDLFSKWQSSVDEAERLQLMKDAGHYMYDQSATMPLGFLFRGVRHQPRGDRRILGQQQLLRWHERARVHQGRAPVIPIAGRPLGRPVTKPDSLKLRRLPCSAS